MVHYVDGQIFFRYKNKVKIMCQEESSTNIDPITCIGIDGKVDNNTLTHEELVINGRSVVRKVSRAEHHLTFTNESGRSHGNYLLHKTIPLKADACFISHVVAEVVTQLNCSKHLSAILVDNTPINTGYKNGFVVTLEKILGQSLHLIGCALHANELPLRALFKKLDGRSTGPNSFTGPLGIMCSKDLHDMPVCNFQPIEGSIGSSNVDGELNKDLSSDQRLLLEYCRMIAIGKPSSPWAYRKIGPLSQARWLTLAIRLLCLYTRTDSPSSALIVLVTFIVKIYAPAWFAIKVSSKLHEMPQIIYKSILELEGMELDDIRTIIKQTFQRNSYPLLSENFVYSLLLSSESLVRKIGWSCILKIRQKKPPLNTIKKIPPINWFARNWTELVSEEHLASEPVLTKIISDEKIQEYALSGEFIELPIYPSHSQSVERAVKLVSASTKTCVGEDSRHRSILCSLLSKDLRPAFSSKGYYTQKYDEIFV